MSMGIVGVNSTVGRAVKCIDPGKTTRSESGWLGYSLCDLASRLYFAILCMYFCAESLPSLTTHFTHRVGSNPILSGRFSHTAIYVLMSLTLLSYDVHNCLLGVMPF